ncbi:LOW QUALITY PROTEIN: hypothetical protein V1478_015351 [Vespula squamosa]|uniref:Uncharacterized protein n=1 Tax=Vespula squamosa TaxID=30214 RepID=A0ABD2A4U0_VESSQ
MEPINFQEFHDIKQQSIEFKSVFLRISRATRHLITSFYISLYIKEFYYIISAHVQEKSSSSSSWGRMLLVQRINKGSEQMQEESSFSSSWGRMLIVQASTKILSKGSRPTSTSTYLIFNQLRIIHPQFRPKSRSSVLEPSQNFLSSEHDRSCLEMSEADGVDGGAFRKRGLTHLQWAEKPEAPEAERHLGTRDLEVPVSPWVPECSNLLAVGPGSEILALHENLMGSKHDRSCLEMSEADGVDGGAFRKRGLTHLQWAEKPEAPEAERHLGTRISRISVSSWVPECSNLLAVGPGSEILALHENLMGSNIIFDNTMQVISGEWLHISI